MLLNKYGIDEGLSKRVTPAGGANVSDVMLIGVDALNVADETLFDNVMSEGVDRLKDVVALTRDRAKTATKTKLKSENIVLFMLICCNSVIITVYKLFYTGVDRLRLEIGSFK